MFPLLGDEEEILDVLILLPEDSDLVPEHFLTYLS
jgi:hypothetical protein